MSRIGVSLAPGYGPFVVNPTWVRIDDPDDDGAVASWNIDRGRASEFDKTKTGTASVTIIDTTGAFDPTLVANMDPGLQASISMWDPVAEVERMLFRGHVTDWFGSWDVSQKYQVVTLQLEDAFGIVTRTEMTPGHHGDAVIAESLGDIYFRPQQVNDRIIKVLDDIGWPGVGTGLNPGSLRNIFSGNVAVQESIYARRDSAMNAIFDAADAEFPMVANVFMSKTGVFTFHGRYARFNPANYATYGINEWKVGDRKTVLADDTYAILSGLDWRRSNQDIVNSAGAWPMNVAETDVPTQIVQDTGSISARGYFSESFDDLLTLRGDEGTPKTAVQETKLFGQFVVDNYADPRTRITTIRFRPRQVGRFGDAALWEFVTSADISDQVSVLTFPNHPGGGGFDEPYFIEGIRYDANPLSDQMHDFTMEIDVSPTAWYDSDPFDH